MNSQIKSLLVTGGAGFLGSRVTRLAREAGWHVRSLGRSPRKQADGVEIFVGDIGDTVLLRKACEGVEAVVHTAGLAHVFGPESKVTADFSRVNVVGTGNVVNAAIELGVPRVVLASSVSVYGGYQGAQCDETVHCRPHGAYAVSKWRGEVTAAECIAKSRSSLTILRYVTIYGEGDRGNVAKLIGALGRGRFVWPGSGRKSEVIDLCRRCGAGMPSFFGAPGAGYRNI